MILDPANPAHRAVLQAARAWGAPVSQFMGYGSLVTRHDHNAQGRLIRSVQESPWTDDDRTNALALQAYEAELCTGCGDDMRVTTTEENQFSYQPGLPVRCHRCTAAYQAAEAARDNPQPQALTYPVELRRREDPPREADLPPG